VGHLGQPWRHAIHPQVDQRRLHQCAPSQSTMTDRLSWQTHARTLFSRQVTHHGRLMSRPRRQSGSALLSCSPSSG
jgi:hypothetical protein